MSVSWEHALTECEARLDAASAALDRGAPAPLEFSAPAVDGPIPTDLVERAQACSARGLALETKLAEELERVRQELRRLPRMPRAQSEPRFQAQA